MSDREMARAVATVSEGFCPQHGQLGRDGWCDGHGAYLVVASSEGCQDWLRRVMARNGWDHVVLVRSFAPEVVA